MNLCRNENGFVLAITIWILAAITIAATAFAIWSQKVVDVAWDNKQRFQASLEEKSTRDTLLYLLATNKLTADGLDISDNLINLVNLRKKTDLGEMAQYPAGLAFDNRFYKGFGKTAFALQDDAGLFGVNFYNQKGFEGFLSQLGVPARNRGPLISKLFDYQDRNSLSRLNGAEENSYIEKNLLPPPNRFLFTTWELQQVMDWSSLYKGKKWDLVHLTSVSNSGVINVNTAPEQVLMSYPGLTRLDAQNLIKQRTIGPIRNHKQLKAVLGRNVPVSAVSIPLLPSQKHRLTIWHPDDIRGVELHIELTPGGNNGTPWVIDYEISIYNISSLKKRMDSAQDTKVTFFTDPILSDLR